MQTKLEEAQEYVSKKCLSFFDVNKKNHVLPLWNLSFAVICYALEKTGEDLSFDTSGICYKFLGNYDINLKLFKWKMMTKEGYTVLFDGQSEETQLVIAKLLGWKGGSDE